MNEYLLVLEASVGCISILRDYDRDGHCTKSERKELFCQGGLNHALIYQDGYLYASSDSTVYR